MYQTLFRAPWCYRVGGSGVRADNAQMPFPRLCANRGCVDVAPENSIPGIAVAVAMGAEEVALDVRQTADGVIVLSREPDVQLPGGETVQLRNLTWAQLQEMTPGKQFSAAYDGVGFASLEAVFAAFPRRAVFQLHIPAGEDCSGLIHKIQALADHYDCRGYFYISSEDETVLTAVSEAAPDVERCLICSEGNPVAKTQKLGCTRFQISEEGLNAELIQNAKAAKLHCNVVLDDDSKARLCRDLGVDCILTGHYLTVRAGLKKH